MEGLPVADIIQTRRDTAATWTSVDPILALGEMGYETDTGSFKFGDGVSLWSVLPYVSAGGGATTHDQLTGVTPDQHHSQAHIHNGADGSGTVSHGDVTDRSVVDSHPTSAITGLDVDQSNQDTATALVQTNLDTHAGDVNIHYPDAPADGSDYVRNNNLWTLGSGGGGVSDHTQLTGVTADQHHAQSHVHNGLDGSGVVSYNDLTNQPSIPPAQTFLHADLTDVSPDQHHAQAHIHNGLDGSGTVAHTDVTGRTVVDSHPTAAITGLDTDQAAQDTATALVQTNLNTHEADLANPHAVTHAQLPDVTANDHHNQAHLLYGADQSDVDTTGALTLRDGLFFNGTNFARERRVNWVGAYVNGPTYEVDDMALESGYLGIANTQTIDGIAPVIVGDPFDPNEGATLVSDFILNTVDIGNIYTMALPAIIYEISFSVPIENVGLTHTLFAILNGVVLNTFTFVAQSAGKNTLSIDSRVVLVGDIVEVHIQATNPTGNNRIYWDEDVNYWLTYTDPMFSDVTGEIDSVGDETAYGVSMTLVQITASSDWDRISSPEGGSTDGGSFTPTTFTGSGTTGYVPDPVTETGLLLSDAGTWVAEGAASLNPLGAYSESEINPVPALELDLATYTIFKKTISVNSAITFTSPLSNGITSFTLQLTTVGTAMPTFPVAVTRWMDGGGPPNLNPDSENEYVFVADDSLGTTFVGYYIGEIS